MAKNETIRKREPLEERINNWIEREVEPQNWYIGSRGQEICIHCRGYERWMNIMDIVTEQDIQQAKETLRANLTQWNDSPVSMALEFGEISDEEYNRYVSSTKKSMNKSKYSDIQKRLNKIGGFTKEDDEPDVEVEIEVEDDDDGDDSARNTGKPADWELEDEEEGEEADKGCKDCKSKKRVKMKKGEDMPEDADDQQDQNEKGTGNAGSELPEEANDQQDINEKGSGNAGSELPEDADEQQDIKESARKTRKAMNRPPVRKFSVTNGGSPDQTSYNGRYQQAPMVRDAIDGHMSSRANKSFDEVAMMNERIANLQKSKRNPSGDNGVPKRLH